MPYGAEGKRMDLNSEGRDVFLLEFTSKMALDEGSLWNRMLVLCYRCEMANIRCPNDVEALT